MGDTIIFMSAYETTKFKKSHQIFGEKPELAKLLKKHHISYIMFRDKILSPDGALTLDLTYDDVSQTTSVEYRPVNKKRDIDDYKEIVNSTGYCVKLLHSHALLADSSYFDIKYLINLQSFLAYIDDDIYQVDPVVFSINGTVIVAYELINYITGISLNKDDISPKTGNFNLRRIKGYGNFGETFTTLSNYTIPEQIYNMISDFFSELVGNHFIPNEYSYVHSTLVLSNKIKNVENYFCGLLGLRTPSTPLENIATTKNYEYYLQDGASVVTKYDPDNIDNVLYNSIILESIKLYIYLFQIINADITEDMNKVMKNDLYLENLFFAPRVPIETNNLLSYVYKTKSFEHRKEAIKLKLAYMSAENETRKNQNSVLLNILLYVVSLFGAISALETLESKLLIPFKCSFVVVIIVFGVFGAIWGITEYRRNKRF